MRLRREASLGIGALLGLQLLLASLAIALLSRMGPAIERILEENVYSVEAVESMLEAVSARPMSPAALARFDEAFERAQSNVTEEAERGPLAAIQGARGGLVRGDPEAHAATVAGLRELGEINRQSMIDADRKAQSLSFAGAWAEAILGALGLALGIFIYRRLRLRLELPIESIRQTTGRVRAGNTQARCPAVEGPAEVRQIAADLNWLLDRQLFVQAREVDGSSRTPEVELRRLLAWLLDQEGEATVIVNARGERVATSHRAIDLEIPREVVVGEGQDLGEFVVDAIPGTSLRRIRERTTAGTGASEP